MFNKIIIVGHLTRDLELRYAPSGTAIGSTGIATTRKFKGGDGQQKEETMFIDITFFGRSAEIANQYLRKGSKVLVEGHLKLDSWTDQNGGKRSKHKVTVEKMTMLDNKGDNSQNQQPQQQQEQRPVYTPPPENRQQQQQDDRVSPKEADSLPEIDINDDEIPF